MKKILPAFLIMLVLFSCKKETIEKQPEPLTYPTEITRTSSDYPEIYVTKFTYNAANQIIKEELLKDNELQRYNLFSYYPDGKLQKKRVYNNSNQFLEQDEIAYNVGSIPVKLQHSYIGPDGTPNLHHIKTFTFDAEGRILRTDELAPDNMLMNSRSYSYKPNNLVESVGTGDHGQFQDKIVSAYDDKLSPFAHTGIQLIKFAGNEIKMELKDINDQVISQYTFTNAYTYNEKGYPLKRIQTLENGTLVTETYVYQSK